MGLFSSIKKGISNVWDGITGQSAADASKDAAQTSAAYQQQALDYLKSRELIPTQFGEGAIQTLGGLYGLEGGIGNQQQFINQAQNSPLYQAMMGGQAMGEDAILRNAAATGGLRSGNTSYNLADYNTQLQNTSLLNAYNSQLGGLQSMAGLNPTANSGIASMQAGIGNTLAMGDIGAAQARQYGYGNMIGLGGSVYQGAGGYGGIKEMGGDLYSAISSLF